MESNPMMKDSMMTTCISKKNVKTNDKNDGAISTPKRSRIEDDNISFQDSFDIHFNNDISNDVLTKMSDKKPMTEAVSLTWPVLGNINVQIPKSTIPTSNNSEMAGNLICKSTNAEINIQVPRLINAEEWNKLNNLESRIKNNIMSANDDSNKNSLDLDKCPLTSFQRELFSVINNYQDLLFCDKTISNHKEITFIYCLHIINHIIKFQSRIIRNDQKLSQNSSTIMNNDNSDEYRDRGLVKPKVLVLVPFRESCFKIVNTLIAILFSDKSNKSVINEQRFNDEFGGEQTKNMPNKNKKPSDYTAIFSGNTDDTFKIGISMKKKAIKLYSDFYSSDIIISSVLGLRMLVGAEGDNKRDYDFLSSIELLIIDQAEIILMQNWDHLIHIFNHLHLQPKSFHDTDISRVRNWNLMGLARFYRQTLIFSDIHVPEIYAIFNKKCVNYAGNVNVTNKILSGSINQVTVRIPQIFCKFKADNNIISIQQRFEFFVKKILPRFTDSMMNHTLIYIPSYFDYVKLRNFFKKEGISFVQICEYSKNAKVARARDMFFHNDAHFLLYSERFHFYRRVCIKGIRHLIFFAPPSFPHFYSELCNFMDESYQNHNFGSENNMSITTLFCKYDIMHLSGILGTDRTTKIIESNQATYMMITDK